MNIGNIAQLFSVWTSGTRYGDVGKIDFWFLNYSLTDRLNRITETCWDIAVLHIKNLGEKMLAIASKLRYTEYQFFFFYNDTGTGEYGVTGFHTGKSTKITWLCSCKQFFFSFLNSAMIILMSCDSKDEGTFHFHIYIFPLLTSRVVPLTLELNFSLNAFSKI